MLDPYSTDPAERDRVCAFLTQVSAERGEPAVSAAVLASGMRAKGVAEVFGTLQRGGARQSTTKDRRDAILHRMAVQFFPNASAYIAARRIHAAMRSFKELSLDCEKFGKIPMVGERQIYSDCLELSQLPIKTATPDAATIAEILKSRGWKSISN